MTESEFQACLNDPELPIPRDTRTVTSDPLPVQVEYYTTPGMIIRWVRGELGPRPIGLELTYDNSPLTQPGVLYIPAYQCGRDPGNVLCHPVIYQGRVHVIPEETDVYHRLVGAIQFRKAAPLRWNQALRAMFQQRGYHDVPRKTVGRHVGFENFYRLFENLGMPRLPEFFNALTEEVFDKKLTSNLEPWSPLSNVGPVQFENDYRERYVEIRTYRSPLNGSTCGLPNLAPLTERLEPIPADLDYMSLFQNHEKMWKTWIAVTHSSVMLLPQFRKHLRNWVLDPSCTEELFYVPMGDLTC